MWDEIMIYLTTAFGAMLLWSKLSSSDRRVYTLSDILDVWLPAGGLRTVAEVVIFVFIGSYLAILLTQPTTHPQAFAAGLGWTGLATFNAKSSRKTA